MSQERGGRGERGVRQESPVIVAARKLLDQPVASEPQTLDDRLHVAGRWLLQNQVGVLQARTSEFNRVHVELRKLHLPPKTKLLERQEDKARVQKERKEKVVGRITELVEGNYRFDVAPQERPADNPRGEHVYFQISGTTRDGQKETLAITSEFVPGEKEGEGHYVPKVTRQLDDEEPREGRAIDARVRGTLKMLSRIYEKADAPVDTLHLFVDRNDVLIENPAVVEAEAGKAFFAGLVEQINARIDYLTERPEQVADTASQWSIFEDWDEEAHHPKTTTYVVTVTERQLAEGRKVHVEEVRVDDKAHKNLAKDRDSGRQVAAGYSYKREKIYNKDGMLESSFLFIDSNDEERKKSLGIFVPANSTELQHDRTDVLADLPSLRYISDDEGILTIDPQESDEGFAWQVTGGDFLVYDILTDSRPAELMLQDQQELSTFVEASGTSEDSQLLFYRKGRNKSHKRYLEKSR